MHDNRSHRRGFRAAGALPRRWLALALLPLAGLGALALVPGAPAQPALAQGIADTERALFPVCGGARRVTCVVDGDTIWYEGAKIRIADIDTPEVSRPGCPREAALGRQTTERLRQLLNAGAFTLEVPPGGRTQDRFGRELRVVKRGGRSLGTVLVQEGLAERWGGPKRRWC